MRAALITEDHKLRLGSVDDPALGEGQLLLAVAISGICGTDLHLVHSAPAGLVLGHEFTGTVERVGPGVSGFERGDQVCSVPAMGCDHCVACLSGDPIHCDSVRAIGGSAGKARGSFADYVVVNASQSVLVPAGVSAEQAALVEPLAVGLNILRRARMFPAEKLLILGAGPIGLAIVLWARQQGISEIVVSDPVASRRKLAQMLGATRVADPVTEDLAALCARELGGAPEVVIECAGRPGLLADAIALVAPYGRVVLAGLHFEEERFMRFPPLLKEISIEFPNFTRLEGFRHTLALLGQGRLDPSAMVTHQVGFAELPRMVEALRTPNDFGKVLIHV